MAVVCCEEHPAVLKVGSLSGSVIGVSGTMGSGKSTFVRILTGQTEGLVDEAKELVYGNHRLLAAYCRGQFGFDITGQVEIIPSYTDRPERGDEMEGEYVHVSTEEFLAKKAEGFFAWEVGVGPYHYGTCQRDLLSVLRRNVWGVINITPNTVLDHIQSSFLYEPKRFKALYVNSTHRVRWMRSRGGLTEEVVRQREEQNRLWDQLVAESRGVSFHRINNDETGNLSGPVIDLAGFLSQI
ncbi:MAG: hypothetical protein WDZ73_01470 [Candidatus Paceibacterota bacterium]